MLLSLDISTRSTGYAILDHNGKVVTHNVISPRNDSYLERAQEMAEQVRLLLHSYPIKRVIIEELKVLRNQKTLVCLAITQGVIIRELNDLAINFVGPSVWRKLFKLSGLKRAEAKKHAISLCRRKGHDVICDDDAEAILIGEYFYESTSSNIYKNLRSTRRATTKSRAK